MIQKLTDLVAIQMICPADIAVGDVVIISAANTVIKLNEEGSLKIVGRVAVHQGTDLFCTIDTPFLRHRTDEHGTLSGASVAVGPIVYDAAGKVINYDADVHDPAAIRGLACTTAGQADVLVDILEY